MSTGRTIALPTVIAKTSISSLPPLVLSGYNITNIALSAGENAVNIPASTKFFRIEAQNNSILQVATSSGSSEILQIAPGQQMAPPMPLDLSAPLILYITAAKTSTTLTVELWS